MADDAQKKSWFRARFSGYVSTVWHWGYHAQLSVLSHLNDFLCKWRKNVKYPNSVLHVSFMAHIPWHRVRILRRHGLKADFLAVGNATHWHKCDYQMVFSVRPFCQAHKEFLMFWRVMAKYEIIHIHCLTTMSNSGWELPMLKRLGRKIVIHYRGCDIREPEKNKQLHPDCNICQNCDYDKSCTAPFLLKQRALVEKYGDAFLVTTPDMLDFVPHAEHFPFFAPEHLPKPRPPGDRPPRNHDEIKIVHVTNHPGIDGTKGIRSAIERLQAKGYPIRFRFLTGVSHTDALDALTDADIAIGKMKMGYYANAQIESMCMGVPTITWVRPEFMTDELRASGFIFCTLDQLEETLEHYLTHPEELAAKRRIARESILRIHDNDHLAKRLIALYNSLKEQP